MKTSLFLSELRRFGWQPDRSNKHAMLTNPNLPAARPLALRHQDAHDIDPCIMAKQAKHAGLIWDRRQNEARLNPTHPYYGEYLRAFPQFAQKAS